MLIRSDDLDDRQCEFHRKLVITLIMGRDGHDGACAVSGEDVVGDPDGDLLTVHGIDRMGAGEDSGLLLGEIGALQIALRVDCLHVGLHSCALRLGGDLSDKRMLGGEHEVGCAKEGIGARREDGH